MWRELARAPTLTRAQDFDQLCLEKEKKKITCEDEPERRVEDSYDRLIFFNCARTRASGFSIEAYMAKKRFVRLAAASLIPLCVHNVSARWCGILLPQCQTLSSLRFELICCFWSLRFSSCNLVKYMFLPIFYSDIVACSSTA